MTLRATYAGSAETHYQKMNWEKKFITCCEVGLGREGGSIAPIL